MNGISPDRLDRIIHRFALIEAELGQGVSGEAFVRKSKDYAELEPLAQAARKLKKAYADLAGVDEMRAAGDKEIAAMAEAERPELEARIAGLEHEIKLHLLPKDAADERNVILEIRAGTGGDEAAIFAGDLYNMYTHYARDHGWKVEDISFSAGEQGGYKEVVFSITGDDVYRELRYESGGHRVQRVPETETKGRIHTSAATVAVLPEPEDVEIDLKPDDYRKDIFCASGPGGQHVNKTASAIRLTHLETNIVVQCQDEKSQHKNFAKALRVLKTRLYEAKRQEEHDKRASERKTLVGSGDRSQRIRTYNFAENRVTDHRINLTLYKLDTILAGDVQPLTTALVDYDRQQQRDEMGTIE